MNSKNRGNRAPSFRERMIRGEAIRRGVTLTQVAREMGFSRTSALFHLFGRQRLQPPTIHRVLRWARRWKISCTAEEVER